MQQSELFVPMADGVRLDVSAFRPESSQSTEGFPLVIIVHGYSGNKALTLDQARDLAERGYVGVAYSVRGQGASEGVSHTLSVRELYDLQEIISWALDTLPVNPRKVAVMGSSQGGWHAYMAAAHDERVACVIAENIFTDFSQMALPNGCMGNWFYTRTMRRQILTAGYPEVVRQWTVNGQWDLVREWARVRSPLFVAHRIRCPVLIIHGWYDEPMPVNHPMWIWEHLSVPKMMYLGSGGHNAPDDPDDAEFRLSLENQWLDHWLKGEQSELIKESLVIYSVPPTTERRRAETFPPPGTREVTWYLNGDGTLGSQPPREASSPSTVTNQLMDNSYDLAAAVADDFGQTAQAVRRDAVVFESDPIPETLELAGIPKFRLYVKSDRPWLQLNFRLFDRKEDGSSTQITRANYGVLDGVPGVMREIEFEGVATAYTLQSGHRLRLEVSNLNHPVIVPFYKPFEGRFFHERRSPSSFTLPVLGQLGEEPF